ncbi:hypothetical protein K1F50_06815 [Muricauda oceani]|uniref:PNPLA domain-containing protein n=1 Tax=Flagellimonas oceani TaxID=2698672 RepID=A0A6G7J6S1_9FLAO|nr:hypothetical protein [Allomuricauda oceani]MBW8242508.1 hypothetical protein [Allomuricauda oceani]QII46268.1 hypothetical protein GVT53_16800 [Allomuricauda oceani]
MGSKDDITFHLGITMAGAVSAGAYSAGFMDYVFEALNLWEAQKKKIVEKHNEGQPLSKYEKAVPLHEVCIDVLGGASAGGMVSVISALSSFSGIEPVRTPCDVPTGNILYDSWVLMDDDQNGLNTFEKMLLTDDFEGQSEGTPSLLNTSPIDKIADKVFDSFEKSNDSSGRPSFISEDLRVLVTLCSLRGIPVELNFENFTSAHFPYSPGHRMNEHRIVAHFKLKYDQKKDKDVFLEFNPYEQGSKELLKLCTKGTGAFPIGLAPRHFKGKISDKYIENCILRSLPIKDRKTIKIHLDEDFFDFTNVDGGTINNEPYSEVLHTLEEMNPPYNSKLPMFGTIMIDPFPNFYNQDTAKATGGWSSTNIYQKTIWQIIPKLYTTLREQVRVKHSGRFFNDYFRLLVFPLKWEKRGVLKNHPPLSCAALGGFGGFLDVEFRKHDFFLGRNNARNLLRTYLMLEYDPNNLHPLFKNLSKEAFEMFRLKKNGKTYCPIIPDLNLIDDKESRETNPYNYTIDDFPKLKPTYFNKIKPSIKKRVNKMIAKEAFSKFKNKPLRRFGLFIIRGYLSRKITTYVIDRMKADFQVRKMI